MQPVRVGIFSLTPPAPADDDGSYLRWHLLDHMPEQYQLPGIALAHRWIADDELLDARLAADGPMGGLANLVQYYVTDPVEPTLTEFMQLGGRLRELGRFPELRPSLGVRMLALQGWHSAPSALVSPQVIALRPHRGVLVLIEEPVAGIDTWLEWVQREHLPDLLDVDGVAGAGMYRTSDDWQLPDRVERDDVVVTVLYLDGDPAATTSAARDLVEQRWRTGAVHPRFAGPLRSMVRWEAWP